MPIPHDSAAKLLAAPGRSAAAVLTSLGTQSDPRRELAAFFHLPADACPRERESMVSLWSAAQREAVLAGEWLGACAN